MNRDRKMKMNDVKDEEEKAKNEIVAPRICASDSLLEHSNRVKEVIKYEKMGQEECRHTVIETLASLVGKDEMTPVRSLSFPSYYTFRLY